MNRKSHQEDHYLGSYCGGKEKKTVYCFVFISWVQFDSLGM